jgi:Domain of unknown function (DUF4868)
MNLFALTSVPGARIVRFPLTADLQVEVEAVFADQLQAFEADIVETIPFDGRYIPDQGELLVIEDFVDVDGLQDAVANPLNYEPFDPALHSFDAVKALFTGIAANGTNRVLVQCFERRRLIANRGLAMFFSGDTFRKMSDAGLTLDTRLLALLEGTALKFQSFHFLRRVFDVSEHYKEATNEEVSAFATHAKLSVDNVASFADSAGQLVRKKIGLILQSGVLDNFTTEQIVASAQSFNVAITTGPDGRIVLPTNKTELRRLLRFLDEDYYESALSQTRYVSNSKRVAD